MDFDNGSRRFTYLKRDFGPEEMEQREPGSVALVPSAVGPQGYAPVGQGEFLHKNSSPTASAASSSDSAAVYESAQCVVLPEPADPLELFQGSDHDEDKNHPDSVTTDDNTSTENKSTDDRDADNEDDRRARTSAHRHAHVFRSDSMVTGDFDFDDLEKVIEHIQSPPPIQSPGGPVRITPIGTSPQPPTFPPPQSPIRQSWVATGVTAAVTTPQKRTPRRGSGRSARSTPGLSNNTNINTPQGSRNIDEIQESHPTVRTSARKRPMQMSSKENTEPNPRTGETESPIGTGRTRHSVVSQASAATGLGLDQSIRQTCKYPISVLRQPPKRSTMVSLPAKPLRAGLAPVPAFPASGVLVDNKPVDMWGRSQCSSGVAVFAIVLSAVFPPLWLLLGSGFADPVIGVLPRRAKQMCLVLGAAEFVAAIALSIVFCLV